MIHAHFEEFKFRFEAVSGVVHLAADLEEAARLSVSICDDAQATCVALGELPQEFTENICEGLGALETAVLRPPYAHDSLPEALDEAQVGIGGVSFGIASTGTLVEITVDDAYRLVSSLPRVYVGIVNASELVADFENAAPRLRTVFKDRPGNCVVSFISGPSRTGDIEMILTLGVHGPETAHAIVVDDVASMRGEDG